MQPRILVAYCTNSGSTREVAEAIGKELSLEDTQVDVRPICDLSAADLSVYTAVVVGGPMILGWHRAALGFLKTHQRALGQVPVAYFMTARSLTKSQGETPGLPPVYEDERLAKPPKAPGKLSLRERYATVANYLQPALRKAPAVKPLSVDFFGGKLDFGKLNILQMLFVMLVIGAQPGDYRNWDAIRAWAAALRPQLVQ